MARRSKESLGKVDFETLCQIEEIHSTLYPILRDLTEEYGGDMPQQYLTILVWHPCDKKTPKRTCDVVLGCFGKKTKHVGMGRFDPSYGFVFLVDSCTPATHWQYLPDVDLICHSPI